MVRKKNEIHVNVKLKFFRAFVRNPISTNTN